MAKSTTLITAAIGLFLTGCAHTPEQTQQDLAVADKKCFSQRWPSEVSAVDCLNAVETPIIKRDNPIILEAYETWASKRKLLAQQRDNEIAPVTALENQFRQGINEAAAILIAHEPQYGDKESSLYKELVMANADAVCKSPIFVTRMNCYDAIMRPIWERDTPDTVDDYDAFQKKRLQLAREYDNSGALNTITAANSHFNEGIKQASNEFASDVRQTRMVAAQAQAKNSQATESNASLLSDENIANLLVQGLAQSLVIVAGARGGGTAGLNAETSYLRSQGQ